MHCVLGAWHMCTELQGRVGARDALNQLTEISHRSYVYPTRFAIAYLGPGQRSGPYVVEASPRRLTYSHCLYVHAMYITAHKIFKTRITPKNAEKSTSDVHSVYASREN